MAKRKKYTARMMAVEAARLADERHSQDIVVLDLRGVSPVTDYFVIATATSDRQMHALAMELGDLGTSVGFRPLVMPDRGTTRWAVLDLVDVVIHIFEAASRRYYDLELIWGDAPRLRWKRPTKTPAGGETPADSPTPAIEETSHGIDD